jgi:hypothetical protein
VLGCLRGGSRGGALLLPLLLPQLHAHLKVCFVPSAAAPAAGGFTGGSGSGPSHLIPLQQPQAAGASFDPGVVCSMLPLHGGAARLASGSGQQQQFAPDAASAMFVPVRPLCCICPAACSWQLKWQLSCSF